MRLLRLRVSEFAGIREADIELGPGLNVLYGSNDLGKSTLASAIRLGLLLPHTSTHIEDYIPWSGGQNPVAELTFETEQQRIWRVRKEFRKGGAAVLYESKNGVDFDEVERGRKVDATIRGVLQWGIPEPGGAGGSKGVPTSFLATALLSTQADVSAVLSDSLTDDPSTTGRERIAAALQAVAQDPLFVSLLRATQVRRDLAYTEKGAKKQAKGSVFKEAADRLREVRDEKERLQKLVEDSDGVEAQLRVLILQRDQCEESVAAATERVGRLERLAREATTIAAAEEDKRTAQDGVERILALDREIDAAEIRLKDLAARVIAAEAALKASQQKLERVKGDALAVEQVASADGSALAPKETVARQALELRRNAAEQREKDAERRVEASLVSQGLVDAAAAAIRENQLRNAELEKARGVHKDALASEENARQQLARLDLLERGLEAQAAKGQVDATEANADEEVSLRARLDSEMRERDELVARRVAIVVPEVAALAPMNRLANDLAAARGALNVGLVVTVVPQRAVELRVSKDASAPEVLTSAEAIDFEADADVEVGIGDIARVRVRGGRRAAQDSVTALEKRWAIELAPVLAAARVADLESLAARVEDAKRLDTATQLKEADLVTLREKLDALAGAAQKLSEALAHLDTCLAALGDTPLESLSVELDALGRDALVVLRATRKQRLASLDGARAMASKTAGEVTLAEERSRASRAEAERAAAAKATGLAGFPQGVAGELSSARMAAQAAHEESDQIARELEVIELTMAQEAEKLQERLRVVRAAVEEASASLADADQARTKVLTEHSAEGGRLEGLRNQRAGHDLPAARVRLQDAESRLGALPVPDEQVRDIDVELARDSEATTKGQLLRIVGEIHKAQGALEQVGGAVARERLRDATEAFELAQRHERDVEDEYDAWLLLLEQMKEADSAQASNLGEALAPAIAVKFQALTQKRYEGVRLTAQLGTDGILIDGTVRSTGRLSVGTREQLSTLYRLSLAEYLGTTVVLDDQLVQSDDTRMDWFRALLTDKARLFQIIVFTCRPKDYLPAGALVPRGSQVYRDADDGFCRALDFERAVRRC